MSSTPAYSNFYLRCFLKIKLLLLVKTCPGVCVAERIADYCEAVLNVADLCKPGLRCCVSNDIYTDNKQQNLTVISKNNTKLPDLPDSVNK